MYRTNYTRNITTHFPFWKGWDKRNEIIIIRFHSLTSLNDLYLPSSKLKIPWLFPNLKFLFRELSPTCRSKSTGLLCRFKKERIFQENVTALKINFWVLEEISILCRVPWRQLEGQTCWENLQFTLPMSFLARICNWYFAI